jgi:hypothetical protein
MQTGTAYSVLANAADRSWYIYPLVWIEHGRVFNWIKGLLRVACAHKWQAIHTIYTQTHQVITRRDVLSGERQRIGYACTYT